MQHQRAASYSIIADLELQSFWLISNHFQRHCYSSPQKETPGGDYRRVRPHDDIHYSSSP